VKRRSKSIILVLLMAVLAIFTVACGSDDDGGSGSDTTADKGSETGDEGGDLKIGMVYDVGGKGDKSFNDAAFEGLTRAADELGVEVKDLEPSADGSNREQLLRQLADEGYGLIIGVGFAFDEVMPAVAGDYPDTHFAVVDGGSEGDNITDLVFAEQEGSFLVGAIAAQASETGTVGFVGGVETSLIQKFEAGYVAGAKAVNPDITVEVKYLTPDGDFSGFADPAKGRTTAKGLFDAGADVVYHASGGSGTGVFEAAAEAEQWVIGVDSNQYLTATPEQQPFVLTSMLKRVDVAVFGAIESFQAGSLESGVQLFDLSVDGVGFATDGDNIPDVAAIEALKQQIIDGEIEVPTAP